MERVAARDLHASKAIRAALGDPAPRGAITELAKALKVSPASVSRWYTLDSSPDRTLWPVIEKALRLEPGTLGATAVSQPDALTEELLRRVDVLQGELTRLAKVVAKQGAQLKQLTAPDRRAAG